MSMTSSISAHCHTVCHVHCTFSPSSLIKAQTAIACVDLSNGICPQGIETVGVDLGNYLICGLLNLYMHE